MKKENALIIIDAQVDFTDPKGALYVAGANEDVKRIAAFILTNQDKLDHIALTLDSHRVVDISHPAWWADANGAEVKPFTPISLADIDSGKYYSTKDPKWSREYVEKLEQEGEFGHFIWPEHCIIGTNGHAISPVVIQAVHAWERKRGGSQGAEYVTKGTNPYTEHFGAFQAQVPMSTDPNSQPNLGLLKKLASFENTYLCGQARNFCVVNSLKQILNIAPDLAKKLVVLEDCMSDVPSMPDAVGAMTDAIFDRARGMGVRFATSTMPIGTFLPATAMSH